MKKLACGCIPILAVALFFSGCADSGPDAGSFSGCTVYESDGMMVMECPLASPDNTLPGRSSGKHSPLGRVQMALRACPPDRCTQSYCWTLCQSDGELCIYNGRPRERRRSPGTLKKTAPNTHLLH